MITLFTDGLLTSAIGQGLLWSILGLGVFVTFRMLNFPDMTTEGSFPLGGAVCVTAITTGIHPLIATILGMLAGMLAGLTTGLLFTKGKIPPILAGIIVMTGLHSVTLFIMQSPNRSLLNQPRIHDALAQLGLPLYFDTVLLGLLAVSVLIGFLLLFFYTNFGQSYIATGDNEVMARSFGIATDRMKTIGLTLSNGIIALAGALIAQNDGYANVNKGMGVIIIGLASIIIGELLFGELTLPKRLVAIVIGSIIYQLLILLVISAGFNTNYLKLFTALVLAICLMLPVISKHFNQRKVGERHDHSKSSDC